MTVVVTIIEFPEGMELSQTSMVFDNAGGTLGRSPENTWVLSDPERFMSGCHCQIVNIDGQYYLIDKSTNGTFLNNSGEPIGKGEQVALNGGDIFEISDYKFQVSIPEKSVGDNPPHSNPIGHALDLDDPFASPVNNEPVVASSLSSSEAHSSAGGFSSIETGKENSFIDENLINEETDPLAALDGAKERNNHQAFQTGTSSDFNDDLGTSDLFGIEPAQEQAKSDAFATSTYGDSAGATEQSVSWPSDIGSAELIPDDWDDSHNAGPSGDPVCTASHHAVQSRQAVQNHQAVAKDIDSGRESVFGNEQPENLSSEGNNISLSESEARRRALEKAYKKLKAQNASLQKQLNVSKQRASGNLDRSLVDAIGFAEKELSESKITEISEISGEFIRKVVEGMMQTLASRNNVKNAFRMNMTTIQPKENNPLKFSANVDDALENMFLKEGDSYKKPLETVQESFESIADHQVAILAGVRSAFNGIAERFNPKELQSMLKVETKKGLIPKNEKALLWEAFCNYYQEQFSDLDNSFQTMFGDDFTLAYEAQLQKLALNRRNKD